MHESVSIPVYIINLPERQDRLAHIKQQFAGRREFDVTIIEACKHEIGAIGLWQSIKRIVQMATDRAEDLIIICEDDHVFTSEYSVVSLLLAIERAKALEADVLLGGISWLTSCLPVAENLYFVEKFSGLQFTLVFRKFFKKILETTFQTDDAADYKISALSTSVYFMFPFISTQKEFGYSDVTPKNNATNRVEGLFIDTTQRVEAIGRVIEFYRSERNHIQDKLDTYEDFSDISIRTYILNPSSNGTVQTNHIISQFAGRTEFDVELVTLRLHKNKEIAYWLSLQDIVRQAMANEDDVIVICDNDHQFTEAYSRDEFIWHIINLHQHGAGIFCGGVDDFDMAVPISKDKFWIGTFESAPFLVIYQTVFDKILQLDFNEHSTTESLFHELTSNKVVLFPFISIRKDLIDTGSSTSKKSYQQKEVTNARLTRIRKEAESSGLI